jgi:lactoylglutathione lyase
MIEVVYLYVTDLERSLGFYRDLLRIPLEQTEPHWAEARLGDTRFALHLAHEGRMPNLPNTIRISLRVDDLDGAVERLRREGVECGEIMRESWGSLAEVRDPDGYEVGLFSRPGASRP